MKRIGNLWPQLVSFENLLLAYRKARRGKQHRDAVAAFSLKLEPELLRLQAELQSGGYRPGEYRCFTIYERKPRAIAAAPFRDRVVHHAILNVLEPPLDRSFISDSYACRKGRGAHAAVKRYQHWAQRNACALKMDIAKYFLSVDHGLLTEKLRSRIKDRRLLELLDVVIDGAPDSGSGVGAHAPNPDPPQYFAGDDLLTPLERPRGIPIGNLTSQFFANLYLDDFDHYIKETLRVPAYLRYVDDAVILDNDKGRLADLRELVRERLASDRLKLHPRKAHVAPVRVGLNLLGYVVYPHACSLRNDNGFRFRRKLHNFARRWAAGRVQWGEINSSVQSWIGHVRHAETAALRKAIFAGVTFARA
jgi:retron-type reverse transcriptase